MAKLGKSKTEKAKQAMGKKTKTEKARAKLAKKTDEAERRCGRRTGRRARRRRRRSNRRGDEIRWPEPGLKSLRSPGPQAWIRGMVVHAASTARKSGFPQGSGRGLSGLVARTRARHHRVPSVPRSQRPRRAPVRPDAPDYVLWVADITYLRTWEGWVYLAAVRGAPTAAGSSAGRSTATSRSRARRRRARHMGAKGWRTGPTPSARRSSPRSRRSSPADAPMADAPRAADRRLRVDRRLVQPPLPALNARHAIARRLRERTLGQGGAGLAASRRAPTSETIKKKTA